MPSASQRFSQRETVSGWRGHSECSRVVTASGAPDAMRRNAAARSCIGLGRVIAQVFAGLPLRDGHVKGPACRHRNLLSKA